MSQTNPADKVNPMLNAVLWMLVVALAFLYVFITFRGIGSAAAMDQAQIAREMARGHGYTTQMIRPVAVQQLQAAGKPLDMIALPDTTQPPLQPAIWAVMFKGLQSMWEFDSKSSVYALDRAVGCLGAIWMILTLLLAHGMARRLFDRTLANFAVLALALSKPLWDMAVTMGSRGLLMFLTTLCLYWLTALIRRTHADEPAGLLPLGISLTCAAMVLTHWMAVWLVLGVVVAIALLLPQRRGALVLIALVPLLALGAWFARNYSVCGDALGAGKTLVQSMVTPLPESLLQRDYENVTPTVRMGAVIRDLNSNLVTQSQSYWDHVFGVVPAVLFFLALLHRFRRPEVANSRWALALILLTVILGTSLVGLPGKSLDDNQIHSTLVPALAIFGLAGFAVLWARYSPGGNGYWTQHGYAVLAILIGGWPTLFSSYSDLSLGLFFKNQLMQWPPYRPDTISQVKRLVNPDELLVSDAPWAVAWYADRPCLWLPKTHDQFNKLRDLAKAQHHHIPGFVITPVATQDNNLITQFSSTYGEWTELIMRGPTLALGPDMMASPGGSWMRDYSKLMPLGIVNMPDGRRVPAVSLFLDYERWTSGRLK